MESRFFKKKNILSRSAIIALPCYLMRKNAIILLIVIGGLHAHCIGDETWCLMQINFG